MARGLKWLFGTFEGGVTRTIYAALQHMYSGCDILEQVLQCVIRSILIPPTFCGVLVECGMQECPWRIMIAQRFSMQYVGKFDTFGYG